MTALAVITNGHSASGAASEKPLKGKAAKSVETKREMILSGDVKGIFCEICGNVTKMTLVGEWLGSGRPKEVDDLLVPLVPPKKNGKVIKPAKPVRVAIEPEIEGNKYWFRCPTCMQVQLIDEWRVQIDRERNLADLRLEDCMVYMPNGIYAVGDAVFHKSLNEIGLVRSKQTTASGASSITVEFQTLGKRQLLENVLTEAERAARLNKKLKSKKVRMNKQSRAAADD